MMHGLRRIWHETEPSINGNNQTRPSKLWALWTPTTGAPLPCSNTLIAYKNLKQKQTYEGNERKWEIKSIIELDVRHAMVGNWGTLDACMSFPHWHSKSTAGWADFMVWECTRCLGCAVTMISAATGILMIGFTGPILYGCRIVSIAPF